MAEDSEVGYGRPPKHSQFKPGKSGNPKGRRPQFGNFEADLLEELNAEISIRNSGRSSTPSWPPQSPATCAHRSPYSVSSPARQSREPMPIRRQSPARTTTSSSKDSKVVSVKESQPKEPKKLHPGACAMRDSLRRILVQDYESFARKAYREDHGKPLGDDCYVTFLCDGLTWLRKTDGGKLVINLPPRHGKTLFGVVYHVAWLLGRNPRLKIIVVTYSGELAEQITRAIREVMRADFYREIFSARLQKDRQKAGHFVTTMGGSVFATSVNGVIAGIGADYIFADDLLSLRDANNPEKVEAVNRIFDAEITSRLNTPSQGRIAVIAHRLDENDLSAHLKGLPKSKHIVLPLVAQRRTRIRLSTGIWLRERGDLLRAGSHTKTMIEKLKQNAEPSFAMLYQQGIEPSNLRLSVDHFRTYDPIRLSAGATVISVDTAVKEGPQNSFTVMQVWAPRDEGFFLIEQFRQQCRLSGSTDALHRLVRRHRPNVILIEDRANGTNLIEA
jgi:hypothetical protein